MLLIFRKHQLCVVLSMFLIFCQILGSSFYKIDHYEALFLKTFSLPASLNCDKLRVQVISAETEKLLLYTYFL